MGLSCGDDHLYFRDCAETLLGFFSIAGFIIRGGFAHLPRTVSGLWDWVSWAHRTSKAWLEVPCPTSAS